MSRLAKKPVLVPASVTLTLGDGTLQVKGAKGEQIVKLPATVTVKVAPEGVMVGMLKTDQQTRADAGTTWSLIQNAIQGVTEGYLKILEIEGVGYRAQMEGSDLILSLGYVNPVRFPIPDGITVTVEKSTIKVSGISKELVGRIASQIRSLKKPEPYKGKGIHYQGEVIRRKVGKKAATTAG